MPHFPMPLIAFASLGLLGATLARPAPDGSSAPRPKPVKSLYPQVMEIFAGHCGTSKCHGGFRPKHQMELVTWQGLKNTVVNVAAGEQPGMKRVQAGDPESSYLFLKITKHRRPGDARIKWKAMPYEEKPPFGEKRLTDAQISLIEEWIRQGAPLE